MYNTEVKYTLILEGLDRLEKGMASAKTHTSALDGALGSLKGAVMGLVGAYASFEFLKDSFKEFEEHKIAVGTLTQMYNNNRDSVDLTLKQLDELAERTESLTGIESEHVMAAEQVLMKYKDLSVSYKDLIPLAGDLATGMGTDIASAADMLGKALENPTRAARLLMQTGASPEQAKMYQQLSATGQAAKAQGYLVDILGEKYKDLAKTAFENDTSRQFEIGMKQVQESIGELIDNGIVKLMPYIKEGMEWVKRFAEALKRVDFEGFIAPVREVIMTFKQLFDTTGALLEQLGLLDEKTNWLQIVFDLLGKAIEYSLKPFKAMLEYSIWFIEAMQKAIPYVVGFGYAVKEVFMGIGQLAKEIFGSIGELTIGVLTFDMDKIASGTAGLKSAFKEYGKGVSEAYNEGFEKYKINATGAVAPAVTDAEQKLGEKKSIKAGKGVGDLTPTSQADKVSGTKQVVINVTIGKLVETVKVQAQNLKDGINQAAPDVAKALLGAVNQFSASADI